MDRLGKKRIEAALAIASYAAGSGTAVAAPTPWLELPKQLVLTASDMLLYATIWKIYFEEDIAQKDLLGILVDVGLVTAASAGTAYLVMKGSSALVCELTDWLGPMGWGIGALISGSLTGIVGTIWALICDRIYTEKTEESTQHRCLLLQNTDPIGLLPGQIQVSAPDVAIGS